MRLLPIQLLIGLFYQTTIVTSTYNSKCLTTCSFPGMICVNGLCVCDSNINLFWTGARCLPCPNHWAISETACVSYYNVPKTRASAQATCESMHSSLISLRDKLILSVIYLSMETLSRRRKRQSVSVDKTVGWTSAQALQLTDLGLYAWNDQLIPMFDSTNSWWCKKGAWYSGFQHSYQEPTRLTINGESEKCVLYRRGKTATMSLCLDDVFCSEAHPFICEKSESTARQFNESAILHTLTNAPSFPGSMNATTKTTHTGSAARDADQTTMDTSDSNSGNSTAFAESAALKSNFNSKVIIIVVIAILLLLVAIIAGVFVLRKYRRKTSTLSQLESENQVDQTSQRKAPPSLTSSASVLSNAHQENDIHSHQSNTARSDSSLSHATASTNFNFDLGKQTQQQKHKPGGYTTQRFNEFD